MEYGSMNIADLLLLLAFFSIALGAVLAANKIDRKRAEKYVNSRLLKRAVVAHARYRSFEKPVINMLRLAFSVYKEELEYRFDVNFKVVEWVIDSNAEHVTISAIPVGELDSPKIRHNIVIPVERFDPEYDIRFVITDILNGEKVEK